MLGINGRSYAQDRIAFDDSTNEIFLSGDILTFYEDPSGEKTIEQVMKEDGRSLYFLTNPKSSVFLTKSVTSAYWIKIAIKNNSASKQQFIVESFNYRVDKILFYETANNQVLTLDSTGVLYPFYSRNFKHKNLIFSFFMDPVSEKIIYLKIKNKSTTALPFIVRKLTFFAHYASAEYFFLGIFYGTIFILFLLTFIHYLLLKKAVFIYFLFYLFFVGIFFMSQDGSGFQFVWPNFPTFNDYAYLLSVYFIIVFLLLYTDSFLNLRIQFPVLHNLFWGTIVFRTLLLFVTIFFFPSINHFLYIDVIPFGLVFYVAFVSSRMDNLISIGFLIGTSFLMAGVLLNFLRFTGLIESSIYTFYSINVCFFIEMIVIYYVLSERIRCDVSILKKESL